MRKLRQVSGQWSVVSSRARRTTDYGLRTTNFSLAFTLIELLVVVAIIAVILTISIPFMRTAIDGGKGMTRAVKDVQEICSHARRMAIMQQTTTDLIIRPGDGTFDVAVSSGGKSPSTVAEGRDDSRPAPSREGGGTHTVKLPENVRIEGLGVNGEDWTEDTEARVRFYANGTCDEMSVVLLDDQNQRRNIWLEVVTGLPELESDVYKFKAR